MSTRRSTTWLTDEGRGGELVLTLPINRPDVEIPVIELVLR
jgi:hypothetical protein